jgi:hypothetical protein
MHQKKAAQMSGFFFDEINLSDRISENKKCDLVFSNGDSFLITYFYTAFTTQTFFGVNRNRLAILHFVNIYGANLYALFTSFTFIMIDNYFISHVMYPPYKYIK